MRLLPSLCPSVCPFFRPHVSAWLPLDSFSWNLILGIFMKICWENSYLVKIGQKYRALYLKIWVRSVVVGDLNHHKSAFCEWNGIRWLRELRRYKDYTNAPQCFVVRILPILLNRYAGHIRNCLACGDAYPHVYIKKSERSRPTFASNLRLAISCVSATSRRSDPAVWHLGGKTHWPPVQCALALWCKQVWSLQGERRLRTICNKQHWLSFFGNIPVACSVSSSKKSVLISNKFMFRRVNIVVQFNV